jgi:adenine-specific DNA-methyltransferase
MPNLKRHLDQFAPVITSHNRPYGLHRARDEKFFKGDKIVAVRKCVRPTFTYTSFPCYVSQTFNVIKSDRVDLMFLTGLLNSRLVRIWLMHRGKRQGHHFQVDKEPLLGIPLHLPGRARQRKIAKLVQKVSSLYERQGDEALTDAQRVRLEHAISGVEEAIDEQIETLYGLDTADRDHLAALDETPHGAAEESTDAASVDEVDDDS